jgi:hypothetical protein
VRQGSYDQPKILKNDASRLLGQKQQQPVAVIHDLKLGNQNSYVPSEVVDVEDPSANVELTEEEL